VADAYVRSTKSSTNYGTATDLRVRQSSTDYRSFLKFDVKGLAGLAVVAAELRLRVTDSGSDGGRVFVVANGWREASSSPGADPVLTWNTMPALPADSIGSAGSVSSGTTARIPLDYRAFAGDGVYSLALKSGSSNQAAYASREASVKPQLVLTLDDTPPTASFTTTATTGTAPLTVSFTDISTGFPTAWAWEFGDGTSSTAQSPSHAYTTAGTYTVKLTATSGAGSDDEVKTNLITVTAAP
jgi:PKD repeat protein